MAAVLVRYWAGAKAAAGVAEEQVDAGTLGEVMQAVGTTRDQRFADVMSVCSFVVAGQPVPKEQRDGYSLADGDLIDVLPPFAGGAKQA